MDESGIDRVIERVGVDSGYATQEVYRWVRQQRPGLVLALDPRQNGSAAIGLPSAVDVNYGGKRIRRGMKVWPVATSMLKSELYGWLKLDKPTEESGDPFPAGYCHFSEMGQEFFEQLCAEQLVTRVVKGYRKTEWVKVRARNEALDTRIYARAAASHFGMDRFNDSRWKQFEEQLGSAAVISQKKAPVLPNTEPPPQVPGAMIPRGSGWLGNRGKDWFSR